VLISIRAFVHASSLNAFNLESSGRPKRECDSSGVTGQTPVIKRTLNSSSSLASPRVSSPLPRRKVHRGRPFLFAIFGRAPTPGRPRAGHSIHVLADVCVTPAPSWTPRSLSHWAAAVVLSSQHRRLPSRFSVNAIAYEEETVEGVVGQR
jgi:hypothetical protein